MKNKVILVIMDGVGISEKKDGNAYLNANTPNLDYLMRTYPNILINASGKYVGLLENDAGNSEVGHNALGCGQIYSQGGKLVDEAIKDESIFLTKTWYNAINYCKNNTLHFIGLLSDGNVHSNINHLLAMIKKAKLDGVKRVRIHILLDGRDTDIKSALKYVNELQSLLDELNDSTFDGKIASGGGRMKITMDRYNSNWEMVKLGWYTHVLGIANGFKKTTAAINFSYEKGITDQYIEPFVIVDENNEPIGKIKDFDSVIFFNYRGDRAIEISECFDNKNFDKFDLVYRPNVYYAGMLQYDTDLKIPKNYLLEPPIIKNTLTEELVKNNIYEYAISETQKYGHVTYFWNGNRQQKFNENLEDYELVLSDKVPFDQKPRMKSDEITSLLINAIKKDKYDFLRINYPNGDMVGHTGNYLKTIEAMEAVDENIGKIFNYIKDKEEYILIITADHGNAEEMLQANDKPKTAHTTNKVPFILCGKKAFEYEFKNGDFGLANVASTIVDLLDVKSNDNWLESMILKK